jgi:hypothetical protein
VLVPACALVVQRQVLSYKLHSDGAKVCALRGKCQFQDYLSNMFLCGNTTYSAPATCLRVVIKQCLLDGEPDMHGMDVLGQDASYHDMHAGKL